MAVVIVLLSWSVVMPLALCEVRGCYECHKVLNRTSPKDHCPITMDQCGHCIDGFALSEDNFTCFAIEVVQRPREVLRVGVGDSVHLAFTFNAVVSCVFLRDGHVVVEDERHVLSVHPHPPRWLQCTLTLLNVSHEDLGDYVLRIHHLTPLSNHTHHSDKVTLTISTNTAAGGGGGGGRAVERSTEAVERTTASADTTTTTGPFNRSDSFSVVFTGSDSEFVSLILMALVASAVMTLLVIGLVRCLRLRSDLWLCIKGELSWRPVSSLPECQ